MCDRHIYTLVAQFRSAIEAACMDRRFNWDKAFQRFPNACCGDTCYLLAEYLQSYGYKSIYVCGIDHTHQSHAWLVLNDYRVKKPTERRTYLPDEIADVYNLYSNGSYSSYLVNKSYEESDLENGLIIDITADQFGQEPIYFDYRCDFYRHFRFNSADNLEPLGNERLLKIYNIIMEYMQEV